MNIHEDGHTDEGMPIKKYLLSRNEGNLLVALILISDGAGVGAAGARDFSDQSIITEFIIEIGNISTLYIERLY
jgi:hypothetical protein